MIDENELEIMNPKECDKYPGYFHIPGYEEHVINKEGKVVNYLSGQKYKTHLIRGYVSLNLYVKGIQVGLRLHRLLGFTFIGRPLKYINIPYSDLVINHRDAVSDNNTLTNLEWCTQKDNVIHANALGLIAKQVPVLVKDIRTGIVRTIRNTEDCAREFDIPSVTFHTHIYSKNAGLISKNWCVFKLDNDVEWPTIPADRYKESNWGEVTTWVATNSLLDKTFVADNHYTLSECIGVSYNRIKRHLNDFGNPGPIDGWEIESKQQFLENRQKTIKLPPVGVRATDIYTGQFTDYVSLGDCARAVGMKHGFLSWTINKSKTNINKNFKFTRLDK